MNWQYENGRIFSENEKNELIAEMSFVLKENGDVDIDHTYVNPDFRGQNIAGQLMEVMAEYLRGKGLKATATCSYAKAWFKKHRQTHFDIISPNVDDTIIACNINGKH